MIDICTSRLGIGIDPSHSAVDRRLAPMAVDRRRAPMATGGA